MRKQVAALSRLSETIFRWVLGRRQKKVEKQKRPPTLTHTASPGTNQFGFESPSASKYDAFFY